MSGSPKIIRLDADRFPLHPRERALYNIYGLTPVESHARTPEEIAQTCADAEAVINVKVPLNYDTLHRLEKCRQVCHTGVGVDATDINAATQLGIVVSNDPFFCTEDVADHTMAMILALARKLPAATSALRRGQIAEGRATTMQSTSLSAATLGLVGFGAIAQSVAHRASAFGLRLLANCRRVDADRQATARDLNVELVDLMTLLTHADYVSLHLPLTAETHHIINAAALRQMKPTAYLINTARGDHVDEAALVRALEQGEIAGAGIDTFETLDVTDPAACDSDHPLIGLEQVISTPHVAGQSIQSNEIWARIFVENLVCVVQGCWPHPDHIVNRDVIPKAPLSAYVPSIFKHTPVGRVAP